MGLRYKIALIFSLLILSAMTLLCAVMIGRSVVEKRSDADIRMAHTAALIRLAMNAMTKGELDQWIHSLFSAKFDTGSYNLDLIYVVIAGPNGETIVSAVNPKARVVGGVFGSDSGSIDSDELKRLDIKGLRKVEVSVTNAATGETTATIYLGYYLISLYRGIGRMVVEALIAALVLIVGAVVLSFFISRRLTRPVEELVSGMKEVGLGNFKKRLPKRSNDEIGFLADGFNSMTEGLREREFIRDTFKRYVTREIAEKLLAQKDKMRLTGEKRNITVLFADIKGFTPLAEKTQPDELVSTLNDFFSEMVDVIFKYEGVLDKFIGDSVMAFWNAPLDQDDAAVKAVQTAIEMRQVLVAFNKRRKSKGKDPLHIGIGINTGEAVAGTIGSEKKMEYTVIGDTVNIAQRLESVTRPGQILITESTFAVTGDLLTVKELPPRSLKGVGRPITIYEVVGVDTKGGAG